MRGVPPEHGRSGAGADDVVNRSAALTGGVRHLASASSVIPGGALTLTGSLTRSYGGVTEPAAGVQVRVWFQATGSTTRTQMTAATVSAAGAFSARVLPKVSGTWTVTVSGVPGYADASSASMPVSVS